METIEILDRAEISGDKVIVEYSKTEAALSELRGKYHGVAYDLTTNKGDKEARAARLELTTLRTSLEKKRKEFKAPALEFGKKIDSEAARITALIIELETPIDQQIKADEARRAAEKAERERIEAERVQGLRVKIAAIWSLVDKCHGISSERIAKGIAQVKLIDTSPDVFAELSGDAEQTRTETLKAMHALHDKAIEREIEVERVEAQRAENARIAEEQRIQAEALKAQQAELDRQRAELAKAQQAKKQAEFDALEKSEIARLAKLNSTLIVEAPTAAPVIAEPTGPRMVLTPVRAATAPTSAPSLKLGDISQRLGFNLTADFLKSLGFEPAAVAGASKLYHDAHFPLICNALVQHIQRVAQPLAA